MGKNRQRYNWKARQVTIDGNKTVQECKVQIELDGVDTSIGYGDTNALVLPTQKEKKKPVEQAVRKVRRLTKKERKKLENVILQKEKKLKRAGILESLAEHQASKEELQSFLSISEVQTGKTKRKLDSDNKSNTGINVISTRKSKKRRKDEQLDDKCDSDDSIHTSDMSTDDDDDDVGDNDVTIVDNEETDIATVKTEPGLENDNSDMTAQRTDLNTDSGKVDNTEMKIADKDTAHRISLKEEKVNMKKAIHIPVARTEDIQQARLKLPILGEEQGIMEAINENPVVIICGETGSGKTTQVPQFLYEAGYAHGDGIIAVTEPRRVAAISMSKRVATEMSLTSREVSYQIRYEGNVTEDTKIKFMTDGVLLKEVQKDLLLKKYSAVVIDEAHERSTYTDILIGLLSRIVPLRHKKGNPLKLIIMSATLRVEDFTENKLLFKVTPPVLKVDARQYPVTIHYNKRTPIDGYLEEAFRKVCKIHRMLPDGGILVFVTGQQEVHTLCRKLKHTFPANKGERGSKSDSLSTQNTQTSKKERKRKRFSESQKPLPAINLDNYSVTPQDDVENRGQKHHDPDLSDDDLEMDDLDLDVDMEDLDGDAGGCKQPLYVLPLYSLLSSDKQALVFGPVPEGYRLCVVATNVAETSLTIPDIKYVVDTGKTKTKLYDKVTGVSKFEVTWTSKASANQRAGRAGRVGPGHCYRLYSSAVFNDEFEKFTPAEITRRPVDDLVLRMKAMNIEKVINFPYPTPPAAEQIQAGEDLLVHLGALSCPKSDGTVKKEKTITPLGKTMAFFPISPRYAKMLAIGHQQNLLPYVIAIVAGLSVQELFIELYSNPQDDLQKDEFKKRLFALSSIKKRWAGSGHSMLLGDLMVTLKAIGACEYEGCTAKFCEEHGIRFKAMKEVRKLRMQLTNTVNTVVPDTNICIDPKLTPPDEIQAKLLRQIVLAGMGDHVARKLPETSLVDDSRKKLKRAYQCQELNDPVFIHPSSVLYKECPEYVVYQHIEETSKLYMKGIVAVEPEWFPVFCTSYVTLSKPLEDPPPDYDDVKQQVTCHMTGTFGRCSWKINAISLEYPTSIDKMKWFAKFLLEGRVVKGLKKYTSDLLSSPSTMVKSWAKLQPRTESLLKELANKGVDDKESLIKTWKKQPNYLLSAIKEWLPQSKHAELTSVWPPV